MSTQTHIKQIVKRDGSLAPFNQEKIANAIYKAAYAVGGHDKALAWRLSDKVVMLLTTLFGPDEAPEVEQIQNVVEKVLIEQGHAKTAKAYILYRHERSKERTSDKREPSSDSIPYKKIWEVLNWNVNHEVDTIEKLNRYIHDGQFERLIQLADEAYEQDVRKAAEAILSRKNEVRIVIIAGPSSSGKTTTTQKIAGYLGRQNLELISLGLDHYFFDLDVHPRDDSGDYDFETPQAMDLELINRHLSDLIQGRTIQVPVFNFKSGKRESFTNPLTISSNQLILIDSLHGLYQPLTASIPEAMKFKVYIETLSQMRNADNRYIRWTDIRLLRRMIRDNQHRNYSPRRTLEHWHYVRRAEMRFIFPYVASVDHIINGALVYELPVLKHYLFKYFNYFLEFYENDPAKQDVYERALRVHAMLDQVAECQDDSVIPKTSLLREFIGGGVYAVS